MLTWLASVGASLFTVPSHARLHQVPPVLFQAIAVPGPFAVAMLGRGGSHGLSCVGGWVADYRRPAILPERICVQC